MSIDACYDQIYAEIATSFPKTKAGPREVRFRQVTLFFNTAGPKEVRF